MTDAVTAFRDEVRTWIDEHLVGEFARWRGRGGIGREDLPLDVQLAWERELASGGWVGLGYPAEFGGRPATLDEQVAFHEELADSRAPARLGNVGATLLGPTLLAFGSAEQQRRFVPDIVRAEVHWCQGYSEPDAGSDLAGIRTRAERDGEEWVLNGQKVWCTLAHIAQWCFALVRTDPESTRHHGLSYLLLPVDQPGFERRPIRQPTGSEEFSELFFDGARTSADLVVGDVGGGWRVAMGTLGFERGAGSLGMQLSFAQQFDEIVQLARHNGRIDDPLVRDGLARSWSELQIMRYTAQRTLASLADGAPGPAASISKLYWSQWYQRFGQLAMEVRSTSGLVSADPDSPVDALQQQFLFGRAVTIFAGSSEIQRNIL
ncbi:MAG: acyl-CoA dehydrogenase family protein, partial [Acidimicrobiales bacterium]|nr:acyl-CoA dehydrogenase family protein [Acidimicrobiales bacterium]